MVPATPEDVWREFSDGLRTYFRGRVSDPADAEDVLQETMLRIVRHQAQLSGVRSISGWVWAIARSALSDFHRRTRPRVELPDDLPDGRVIDVDDRLDMACCVGPLLAGLSVTDRQVLLMVDVQGVSQVEAARQLGLSTSGLKSRVQRARQRMRRLIEACCQVTLDARARPIAMSSRHQPSSDTCGSGCGRASHGLERE